MTSPPPSPRRGKWPDRREDSGCPNGGLAELYVIFATVAPGTGSRGVTAFVVEKGDAGVSFGEPMRKLGQRAIPD